MEVGLTWLHNGTNIVAEDTTFSPQVLNHNLIIKNTLPTQSGVYTCSATVGELTAEQNITVTVIPGEYIFCVVQSKKLVYYTSVLLTGDTKTQFFTCTVRMAPCYLENATCL